MSDLRVQSRASKIFSSLLGYSTILATVGLLFFFLVYPVGIIISKAFLSPEGFTLEYFRLLFSNNVQTTGIWNSLLIGLGTTVIATLVSFPLAIISARYEFKGK